jgi:hypothetical protein
MQGQTLDRSDGHFKDAVLDGLAERANVAQFISFDPQLSQRYSRVVGFERNHDFGGIESAVQELLRSSLESSVNVRSFRPLQPQGQEFIYGITEAEEASRNIRRLAEEGLHTIVNETIDIADGGVSGVRHWHVIEFAPGDTPRAVEKPGTLALSADVARDVLETVYGFSLELDFARDERVEFSLHPRLCGYRREHIIIWEVERAPTPSTIPLPRWPNRFSQFVGDKAFGLLLASLVGLRVPSTTVLARNVPPFRFGQSTGTGEVWVRTAPALPTPGRFPTVRGWTDPFALLSEESQASDIVAVLVQEGVEAQFAGAASVRGSSTIVEGVQGDGMNFMLGALSPQTLPNDVVDSVEATLRRARDVIGVSRVEWVYDGADVWIVQAHQDELPGEGRTLFPGHPENEVRFDINDGLEELRSLVARLAGKSTGVVLVGDVGITSHFGDVLRRAEIPSRIES